MKGFLIDVVNGKTKAIDCKNDLHSWYELLNCSVVDMPNRKIGDKYYTFVCDDEGLLKNNPIISAVDVYGNVALVGNILIFGINEDDYDITDLTEEDIKIIKSNICQLLDSTTGEMHEILINLEY